MSRDPERIPEMIRKVVEIWEKNPDLRLMQLMMNPCGLSTQEIYYMTDEELMVKLDETYNFDTVEEIHKDIDDKGEMPDWGWVD